ncbi:MAG: GGDEF domain-containing protein [Clostridium sp.]|nr:GGDEF domain-containing protein [Clostridium sp.]
MISFKMRSQNIMEKLSRQGTKNLLASAALKLFVAAGFFVVFGLLRSHSVESCLKTLRQEAQEAGRNVYRQFSSLQDHLEILADIIGQEGLEDSAHLMNILAPHKNIDMISRLGILLPDNQIMQPDGSLASPVNGITFDALAEKGAFITNIEPDNLNPDNPVLFSNVPIVIDGKTEAILFGVTELHDIPNYVEVNIMDGNADLFIVDIKNKQFIMDTLHSTRGTSESFHGRELKKGFPENQITQDFAEGRGGVTAYLSESIGEYLYAAYEAVGINDWYVMLTVPERIVLKEAIYIKKILLCLGIYEAAMLFIYVWWDIIRTQKELRAIEKVAMTDMLTNLKNRNAYEQALEEYSGNRPECLSCVYADANGLHELNNSQGHHAGDKMLQFVADAITEAFGKGAVYRIGGDEFLAFTEEDERTAEGKAARAKEKAATAGYHVSVGTASGGKTALISEIVKAAEQRMYEDKRRYYMSQGDRRSVR